jgi:hypothetical protein
VAAGPPARSPPGLASRLAVVHRVHDDGAPQPQVLLGGGAHGLVGGDAGAAVGRQAAAEQGVLDVVDGQVDRAPVPRQRPGDGRLADAGQPRDDDQHHGSRSTGAPWRTARGISATASTTSSS